MIELALEHENKLHKFKQDKSQNLEKLENVQKEINKTRKFLINKNLVGLIIGKGVNYF